jgi:hypothetical protein
MFIPMGAPAAYRVLLRKSPPCLVTAYLTDEKAVGREQGVALREGRLVMGIAGSWPFVYPHDKEGKTIWERNKPSV